MIIAERISVRQNNRVLFVAERISVRQIIVLYLWFCMYICLQRPSQGTPNPYVHYPVYFINEIVTLQVTRRPYFMQTLRPYFMETL